MAELAAAPAFILTSSDPQGPLPACDFTKRSSDGIASAPLPRHEPHPELSAFIGGPIKNVLALGNTPNKDLFAADKPMNADWKLSDSNRIHRTASDPSPQSQIVQSGANRRLG
jgi:hypothetical protein